eukprot:3201010-Prymnesium_polylepis.2
MFKRIARRVASIEGMSALSEGPTGGQVSSAAVAVACHAAAALGISPPVDMLRAKSLNGSISEPFMDGAQKLAASVNASVQAALLHHDDWCAGSVESWPPSIGRPRHACDASYHARVQLSQYARRLLALIRSAGLARSGSKIE